MAHINDILEPEDLRKVANLRVFARQLVEGACTGMHASPHKGQSVEFREHRAYTAGDEIRHLDWKVFGKTDRYYIREYEEETNLRTTLLLDTSDSMRYGVGPENKYDFALRLCAMLAYLLVRQQDSVGLITFDNEIREHIPPRSRPSHLNILMEALEKTKPGRQSDVGQALHGVCRKLHRRGLVILISDCFGDTGALMKALAHLRHDHHDVLILQVWHRDELEFPFTKWTQFKCLEGALPDRMVDPAQFREAYLDNLKAFRGELERGCRTRKVDLAPLTTDTPYADALATYLSLRSKAG